MPDIKRDANGVIRPPVTFAPSGTDGKLIHSKLDFDPETGSTKTNEEDQESVYALIQTYADQCGMAYIQKMIANGMLSPEKVSDDGNHGGDSTLPIDANDAYRASLANDASIAKLESALGIKLGDDTTPEQIRDALAKIYQAQQTVSEESKKEAE